MISSESVNLLLPSLLRWWIIMSQIILQKDWFAVCMVKVTVNDHIIKILLSKIFSELLILLQLGFMVHYHKLNCLVKRFDCSVVVKAKVTEKIQNSSDCSSGRYLLNCCFAWWCIIMGQWHQEDWFVCCLQVQDHNEGWHIRPFLPYLLNCWSFFNHIWLDGTSSLAEVFCVKIRLLFSRSRTQCGFKTLLHLYVSNIFCTTYILVTKLDVLIYC